MNHLIVCTEYPPADIPPGGIGTYAFNISHLLAEAGETVHVVGPLWAGASKPLTESCNGRLILHRVPIDEVIPGTREALDHDLELKKLEGLRYSEFPHQCFSWQAAHYIEKLVEDAGIDVIESQEINAPLYFYQLRRALGLGPRYQPPCFVHLHSSSEQIVRYNEWNASYPHWITAKRLEDYSIAAADALLCPSQFLSRQTEAELGLDAGTVTSIPLPIGDTPLLERSDAVWTSGTVCYVGRLEPRKGIIEWVDAVVSVAGDYPGVDFEFVGADLAYTENQSVLQFISDRIPDRLRKRLHFRGSQSRDGVVQYLRQARIAVVPSRWENFPNTCVEAMCSGLPVLASPNGGMAEMIEDGETGWLAANASRETLAHTLRRALDTQPARLAAMGARAAQDIRRLCDNDETVQRHLEFRRAVARRGTDRSLRLPSNLPWSGESLSSAPESREARDTEAAGTAIVVDCTRNPEALSDCMACIKQQGEPPKGVVLLVPQSQNAALKEALSEARSRECQILAIDVPADSRTWNEGIRMILDSGREPFAIALLDSLDRLQPDFLRTCTSTLRHCPDLAVVSAWTELSDRKSRLVARACPAFPYQLLENDVAMIPVIRTEAMLEADFLRADMTPSFSVWNLINLLLASGWKAATVPDLLSQRATEPSVALPGSNRMYGQLLASTPEVVARYSQPLAQLLRARLDLVPTASEFGIAIDQPRDLLRAPFSQILRIVRKFIRDPRPGVRFMLHHLRGRLRRSISSAPRPSRTRRESSDG